MSLNSVKNNIGHGTQRALVIVGRSTKTKPCEVISIFLPRATQAH